MKTWGVKITVLFPQGVSCDDLQGGGLVDEGLDLLMVKYLVTVTDPTHGLSLGKAAKLPKEPNRYVAKKLQNPWKVSDFWLLIRTDLRKKTW